MRWLVPFLVLGACNQVRSDLTRGFFASLPKTDDAGNTSEFSAIADVAVVNAFPDGAVQVDRPVAVRAELYNAGAQAEDQVPVACSLQDVGGAPVYQEIAPSGERRSWARVFTQCSSSSLRRTIRCWLAKTASLRARSCCRSSVSAPQVSAR